jgi:DNA-binding MarR family transcriptional regulator
MNKLNDTEQYTKDSFNYARDKIIEDWMVKAIEMEILVNTGKHREPKSPLEIKFRTYFDSNQNRRNFLLMMIKNKLTKETTLVTPLANSLGISRNHMNTMLKECSANGWVVVGRNEKGWREVQGTELITNFYYSHSKWRFYYFKESGMEELAQLIVGLEKYM